MLVISEVARLTLAAFMRDAARFSTILRIFSGPRVTSHGSTSSICAVMGIRGGRIDQKAISKLARPRMSSADVTPK